MANLVEMAVMESLVCKVFREHTLMVVDILRPEQEHSVLLVEMLLVEEAEAEAVLKAESFGLLFLKFLHSFLQIPFHQIATEAVPVELVVAKVVVVVSVEAVVKVQEVRSEFLFGTMDLMA
jgi:hypothetical protein